MLRSTSPVTKLKDLTFQRSWTSVQWVTMALQTVRSTNIRHITMDPRCEIFPETIAEADCREWEDLDRLLVQIVASHLIRPKVLYKAKVAERFRGVIFRVCCRS